MTGTASKETKKNGSPLEEALAYQIKLAKLPTPEREYYAIPGRKFRWDFAWPEKKLLVEVQGAVFVRGAHSTGAGIHRDCNKLNLATIHGYRSLAFTSIHIKDGSALTILTEVLSCS